MLSGSSPRGSSSTPVRGNSGRLAGKGRGSRCWLPATVKAPGSREQDRGEALARLHRQRIGRPHRLEQLDQLLARGLLVPVAIGLDDLQQVIDRRLALAG